MSHHDCCPFQFCVPRIRAWCVLTAVCAVLASLTASRAVAQQRTVAGHPQTSALGANALLRPGDVVRLRIWREPDLSGDFPVNESGVVVVPRIGPITVADQTPDSLRAQLFRSYGAILSHKSIEVIFLRRIQILGAVRNPGLYPLDPTMTVGDALAVAGGTTPDGDPDRLELHREGAKVPLKVTRRTSIETKPLSPVGATTPPGSAILHPVAQVAASLRTSSNASRSWAVDAYCSFSIATSAIVSFATPTSTARKPVTTSSTRAGLGLARPRPIPAYVPLINSASI